MTFTDRIGWPLLHFVWQGALIAVALGVTRSVPGAKIGEFQARSALSRTEVG